MSDLCLKVPLKVFSSVKSLKRKKLLDDICYKGELIGDRAPSFYNEPIIKFSFKCKYTNTVVGMSASNRIISNTLLLYEFSHVTSKIGK